ncbi:hypothetical protein EDC19_1176 [Natranaerovirga hydrolytica]|uniref:Uncharacterized protein n=1 Tax=Natranaerovirga hydrolytica TaxID=680378 RepID=A0A4V2Q1S7_9FIRM|nr:hypothetical protein EDC19_1176 [Natranaerovirga hydrolytica]
MILLILIAVISVYVLYRLITEHIDQRFEELKEWIKENS